MVQLEEEETGPLLGGGTIFADFVIFASGWASS